MANKFLETSTQSPSAISKEAVFECLDEQITEMNEIIEDEELDSKDLRLIKRWRRDLQALKLAFIEADGLVR